MPISPIFIVDGAPAAGKTTLCRALMDRFERGFHIPVDDLREWVVKGIAHPLYWTDETARQFRIAELAAVDLAIRYQDAGFAVAIDHCRRLEDWDEVLDDRMAGRPHVKVVLGMDLETNLARNLDRTNKDFDTKELETIIRDLNVRLVGSAKEMPSWHVVENGQNGIDSAVDRVLSLAENLR